MSVRTPGDAHPRPPSPPTTQAQNQTGHRVMRAMSSNQTKKQLETRWITHGMRQHFQELISGSPSWPSENQEVSFAQSGITTCSSFLRRARVCAYPFFHLFTRALTCPEVGHK